MADGGPVETCGLTVHVQLLPVVSTTGELRFLQLRGPPVQMVFLRLEFRRAVSRETDGGPPGESATL